MQSLIRIILLIGVVGGIGYYASTNPDLFKAFVPDPKISEAIDYAGGKVEGAISSLNIDAVPLINKATQKIINRDIIKTDNSTKSQDSSSSAAIRLQQITSQITEEIKDIPKNQAKEIIQNTCQQIIDSLK